MKDIKKKVLIALLLMSFSKVVLGQKFTVVELKKMTKMDDDVFDTYVTTKGYKYSTTEHSSIGYTKIYSYRSDKWQKEYAQYFIYTCKYAGGSDPDTMLISIKFQTTSSKDYLSFKNQLKTLGCKYTSSTNYDDENTLYYNSPDHYLITLSAIQRKGVIEDVVTNYFIDVINVAPK